MQILLQVIFIQDLVYQFNMKVNLKLYDDRSKFNVTAIQAYDRNCDSSFYKYPLITQKKAIIYYSEKSES